MSESAADGIVIHRRAAGAWAPPLDPALDTLLGAGRNVVLATTGASGIPQLSPVWFHWDGGRIVIVVRRDSVKARNVAREPRVALCLDDEPGGHYATLTGRTAVVDDPPGPERPAIHALVMPILAKHFPGPAEAEAYWRQVDGAGDFVALVVEVERILWFGGLPEG